MCIILHRQHDGHECIKVYSYGRCETIKANWCSGFCFVFSNSWILILMFEKVIVIQMSF